MITPIGQLGLIPTDFEHAAYSRRCQCRSRRLSKHCDSDLRHRPAGRRGGCLADHHRANRRSSIRPALWRYCRSRTLDRLGYLREETKANRPAAGYKRAWAHARGDREDGGRIKRGKTTYGSLRHCRLLQMERATAKNSFKGCHFSSLRK
jgi:hypothetical protein